MKTHILNRLQATSGIISGELLSAELGISRVSIWKHIRKLQEIGYNIIATSKGYPLIDSLDALFPWEFPGRESKIHYFAEVGSTMENARELARKGCPDKDMESFDIGAVFPYTGRQNNSVPDAVPS